MKDRPEVWSAEPEVPPGSSSGGTDRRGNEPTAQAFGERSGAQLGRVVLAAGLLVLITFAAYQPVWHAGFIWDDDVMVTANRAIRAAGGLRAIWFSTELPDYFPLTSTVLWLEWRWWGANAAGYHLVNVLLHALSAVVLWRVLTRLMRTPNERSVITKRASLQLSAFSLQPSAFVSAWLAAAIFALHPVNVESVAWITELKNTLAMFFFLLTLLAYLRFEESREGVTDDNPAGRVPSTVNLRSTRLWYVVAFVAFVLALLSKTAVAPLPLVLLGIAWWRRGRVTLRDGWRSAPFFAASLALAMVTIWFQHHRAIASAVVRTDGFWSRLAGAGWAVWFYLYKSILPVNLSLVYPRWQIDPTRVLSYLPGALALAGVLLCWRFRERWGRVWLFAFGFFVVMLAPVLGFLNISFMRYSLVADRWQYFALLGPIALVAAGIGRLGKFAVRSAKSEGGAKIEIQNPGRDVFGLRISDFGFRISAALGCAALLATLGVLTWRHAGTYADPESLWTATLARDPNCFAAHTEIGNRLVRKGRLDEAISHYEAALKVSPDYELARYNFGFTLLQRGETAPAIVQFRRAIALQPDYLPAQYHLGNALYQSGELPEAIVHLKRAVELDPGFAEGHNSLGNALLHSEQEEEAIAHFRKALELQPDYPHALNNLGVALFREARWDEAMALFQRAVELQPGFAEGQNNLGRILFLKGHVRAAVAHYRASLKAEPDDPDTLSNLAWVLATCPEASLRNGAEALDLARRANQAARGENPAALRTMAAACAETGRFDEAIAFAHRAFKLAQSRGDEQEMESLRRQLQCYEADAPFHDPTQLVLQ